MMEFDDDAARRVEAAYTTPDIVAQRASVSCHAGARAR